MSNKPGAVLALQLTGYRLTTAEVLYYMPDHPSLLQSFVWQKIDLVPGFPALKRFLDYWRAYIEADLHSVRVASAELLPGSDARHVEGSFRLN